MGISRRRFVSSSVLLVSAAAARAACPRIVLPGTRIRRIEVETWTGRGENDRTGDAFECRIHFADGRSLRQALDNPEIDDREVGQRDRFRLDLTTAGAASAVSGQPPGAIRALEIRKVGGSNAWVCEAVGLRVNDVVILSRYVAGGRLESAGESFRVDLRGDGGLDGIELRIRTANAPKGQTDDAVYCNVVFGDGTLLYPEANLLLNVGGHVNDFERNNAHSSHSYLLPLPAGGTFAKSAADIGSFYLRKEGTDGWLLRSARLFADGDPRPVLGNAAINQFLDDSRHVLRHSDWSSRSLAVPVDTPASRPLPAKATYAICGPVLGHVGADSARVVYRVEAEGRYRVTLRAEGSTVDAAQVDEDLCPAGTFSFSGLAPDTGYRFEFFRMAGGTAHALPEGNGAFRTRPPDGAAVRFAFAVGSCARNGRDEAQPVWDRISEALGGADPVRFFVHLGDTTYFFDDVSETQASDSSTLAAGFLAARKHPGFLRMARRLPCYAIWDDHDFRYNNATAAGYALKAQAARLFRDFWGNPDPMRAAYGLTTRFSYGNVDFYLMDGRFNRNPAAGAMFTSSQCRFILDDIAARGPGRMRVLMSGSLWNNTKVDSTRSAYGNAEYRAERRAFFAGLDDLLRTHIEGLVFLSGDVHVNEIYEVRLVPGGTTFAPEIVCSPLTANSSGTARPLDGERKWQGPVSQPGFARIAIDTTASPWTLEARFTKTDGTLACAQSYALQDRQFRFSSANTGC